MLNLSLAVLNHLQQPLFHGPRCPKSAFQVCVLLSDVLATNLLVLEFSQGTELQDKRVQPLGQHANDDAAPHLAIR